MLMRSETQPTPHPASRDRRVKGKRPASLHIPSRNDSSQTSFPIQSAERSQQEVDAELRQLLALFN